MDNYVNPKFNGFYRAEVKSNKDPLSKGRIKVHIPGIYPEKFEKDLDNLPWAEPAMPIFGGSGEANFDGANLETGVTSSPHKGAFVWVFFERGEHMKPIYTFAIQSGDGWMSEHEDQHVIQTDNVRITVDDRPTDENATRSYSSNNQNCVSTSKKVDGLLPTIDIEVNGMANIVVNGDVNYLVKGNYYFEVEGDSYETVHGNRYERVLSDSHQQIMGTTLREHMNNTQDTFISSHTILVQGDRLETVTGNNTVYVGGTDALLIADGQIVTTTYRNVSIAGDHTVACAGTTNDTTFGNRAVTTGGLRYDEVSMDYSISASLLRLN